ncbi:MAG: hypothetical protein DRN26_03805 [Thermoplasmata archaeon]|nr:MAG: hypothetical protein DRN26_03805 [Thermoplasmata archaeon]
MSSKTKLSNKLIPDHISLDYAARQKERLEKNWSKFPPPLRELLEKVKQCRKCPGLVKSRESYLYGEPTFGYGNPDSPVVLIAQAPGWLGAVHEDTEISTFDGTCLARELEPGDMLLTGLILQKLQKKTHKLISIKMESSELTLTNDHPVLTQRGWVIAKNIKQNDIVYMVHGCGNRNRKSLLSWIIGLRWLHNIACQMDFDTWKRTHSFGTKNDSIQYRLPNNKLGKATFQGLYLQSLQENKRKSSTYVRNMVQVKFNGQNIRKHFALSCSKTRNSIGNDKARSKTASIAQDSIWCSSLRRRGLQTILENPFFDIKQETVSKVSKANTGSQKVVDFSTISGTYVANGILVHNCGTTGFVFEPLSRTGKIYEAVLRAAGLSFEHVYTTNLVKCCPRGSDAPTKQQIRNCEVYCLREIKLINPFSIIAVGKLPWDFVMRNKLYKDFQCHRVFHPGYILRKGFGIDRYISSFAALLKSEYKKGASKKGLRRWL